VRVLKTPLKSFSKPPYLLHRPDVGPEYQYRQLVEINP
jgi:hypothetical protein